jgi:hypothetical protein
MAVPSSWKLILTGTGPTVMLGRPWQKSAEAIVASNGEGLNNNNFDSSWRWKQCDNRRKQKIKLTACGG